MHICRRHRWGNLVVFFCVQLIGFLWSLSITLSSVIEIVEITMDIYSKGRMTKLFLLAIIYFQIAVVVSSVTTSNNSSVYKSMRDFTKLNTAWHVYIQTMIYDIVKTIFLHVSSVGSWSRNIPQSLLKFTGSLPHAYHSRYPCQLKQVEDMSSGLVVLANSRVCGKVSTVFSVVGVLELSPTSTITNYQWVWYIKVNRIFKINITFLQMKSTLDPNCHALQAVLLNLQKEIWGKYCPGNPVRSFYSHGDTAFVLLNPVVPLIKLLIRNHFMYKHYGSCSFLYQVLENKFSSATYRPHVTGMIGRAYLTLLDHHGPAVSENLKYNVSNTKVHVRNGLEEFIVFKESSILIYEIRAPLGDTLSVFGGEITCSGNKAHVVFYDGPHVDLFSVDQLLSRIHTWDCSNGKRILDRDSISSSIGDMLLVVIVSGYSNWTPETIFIIGFNSTFPQPVYSRNHTFSLNNTHRSATISVIMENTFMHVIAVRADMEEAVVEMAFEHISYIGHFQIGCSFGGMYILGPLAQRVARYIGTICSSEVAKKFLDTYNHTGMLLDYEALIVLKQYYGLSGMGANLTFFIGNCPGIFNFKLDWKMDKNASYRIFHEHRTGAWWALSPKFYSRGFNQYYSWTRGFTIHLNLRNLSCWTLNYFILSQIYDGNLESFYKSSTMYEYSTLHLHLNSADRTSSFMVSINVLNTNPIIQELYECFGSGFRALPDNRNDEPYIYTSSHWDTFSMSVYNVKIRINMLCLIFGANVYLKFERPQYQENTCFTDIGGYMYDKGRPVVPQGVCGDFSVHLDMLNRRVVSLTTPHPHPRCCYYNLIVENNNCISRLSVYRIVTLWATLYRGGICPKSEG